MTMAVSMMPMMVTMIMMRPGRKNHVLELASLYHMRDSRAMRAPLPAPGCRSSHEDTALSM